MARIATINKKEDLAPESRTVYDAILQSRGAVGGPWLALLHSPELAGRTAHLGSYVRFESSLDRRLIELAALAAARELDCKHEWAAHVNHAQKAGIPVEVALQYNTSFNENVHSYVNNINTHEGGTHLAGFRRALTRTLKSYAEKSGALEKLKFNEAVKGMLNRMVTDLIDNTRRRLADAKVRSLDDVRRHPERLAAFSPEVDQQRKQCKDFLYANVYLSSALRPEKDRAEHVMLVDLARNVIGRVSRPGTVRVRITAENARGIRVDTDEAAMTVPDFTGTGPQISTPVVYRGRTARDLQQVRASATAVPAVRRVFSRMDRLLLRFGAASQALTEARARAMAAGTVPDQAQAETAVTRGLRQLLAVAEAYPQLRANENFLALQEELTATESKIAFARQEKNSETFALFTMNADGTELVQRSSSPRHELDPGWVPDGSAIVAEVIDTGSASSTSFTVVPLDGAVGGVRSLAAAGVSSASRFLRSLAAAFARSAASWR